MLRVLHQVSGRRSLCLTGGHHLVLLWRGALLRLQSRGADRHPDHVGEPLLTRPHAPRHTCPGVSNQATNRHRSCQPSELSDSLGGHLEYEMKLGDSFDFCWHGDIAVLSIR